MWRLFRVGAILLLLLLTVMLVLMVAYRIAQAASGPCQLYCPAAVSRSSSSRGKHCSRGWMLQQLLLPQSLLTALQMQNDAGCPHWSSSSSSKL
jgi:hypothetical protein